ncbi:MAG: UbiA family prenyltransferase [Ktedonobacterales bacterium]
MFHEYSCENTDCQAPCLKDIALGFFLLTHPGPVALFLGLVTVFALRASWPQPIWTTILLVIAAHAAMQFSISMINDYCDRQLDANRPDKPIARGWVLPREALITGLIMIVVMVVLLLPLNPLALLVSLCYLALGQAYNLGLKSTRWSGIVLALMVSLIPLYVFAGVGHVSPVAFWMFLVGILIGISLNVANSLPDIEGDASGGSKTLAVVLGVRRSIAACPLLLALTIALIAVLTASGLVPAQFWILAPTLTVAALTVGALLFFLGHQSPGKAHKVFFYLVALTCFELAGGWFLAMKL